MIHKIKSKIMCNCINVISQNIRDNLATSDDVVEVEYVSISRTVGAIEKVMCHVDCSVVRKLKSGKLRTDWLKQPIIGLFCPFCGEKY